MSLEILLSKLETKIVWMLDVEDLPGYHQVPGTTGRRLRNPNYMEFIGVVKFMKQGDRKKTSKAFKDYQSGLKVLDKMIQNYKKVDACNYRQATAYALKALLLIKLFDGTDVSYIKKAKIAIDTAKAINLSLITEGEVISSNGIPKSVNGLFQRIYSHINTDKSLYDKPIHKLGIHWNIRKE